LDEARAVATEVDALYERMGRPRIHQVRPTRAIREVALSTGDWRRAVSELERDILEEPDPHYRLSTHQLLAVWLSRIGGVGAVDDVVRHVTVGRQDAEAAGCPRCAAELDLRSAEALARVGRPDAAVAHLLRQRTADPSRPLERAYRRWIAGLEAGSSDAAVATLSETLEDLTSLGLGLEGIWLRLDLARALEPSDRAAAIAQLRSAMQLAGERGARTEQKHADQELRRLGARTWRRGAASRSTGRGDLEVLSDREVEIARAAAAGASNPEIAEQLFLSRRTVEHHLSSILRKLDLRNRTELASIVALRGDGPGVEGRSD
jgi:DNA-binding CsgD family transcriptional regulator